MPEYERTRARSGAERVYRVLLHVYPADFQLEFGDAMMEFFRDRLTAARRDGGGRAIVGVWSHAVADLLRNAVPARIDSWQRAIATAWQRRVDARHTPFIHALQRKDWMLSSVLQDLRYALRGMLRQPAFTVAVLATLTLGIGANAAIFSVVQGVLLRPLPYRDAARIVFVHHLPPYQSVSEPEFYDYKREARSFETLAALANTTANVTGGSADAERIVGTRVSDGFFRVLGVEPLVGRAFLPEEDTPKSARVVVLSYAFWQRRYGGDRGLVGQEIVVNGVKRTVVGIMPPHFAYPSPEVAAWFPMRLNPDSLWGRNNHHLELVGRLAPGATVASAEREITNMAKRFQRDYPETYSVPMLGDVHSVNDVLLGRTRPYLLALFGTVVLVLLIACVNVANLLLARGESRRRELSLRTALGASRVRLARQMLTESLLLALGGGACGLLAASLGVRALVAAAPENVPRLDEVHIDSTVLLFTMGVTIVTGLLFGLLPALRSARDDAGESLKAGGKTGGQARGLRRARSVLVVCEVALAVVTLTGAGLMIRSLEKLQAIDLGIRPAGVLDVLVGLPAQEYQGDRAVQFYSALLSRVRALPGVVSAGAVGDLPLADGNSNWSILLDGQPPTTVANAPSAMPEQVTPQYFQTMGIPVVRGREFTNEDRAGAPLVVIVNQAMEKKYWGAGSALGHTVKMLDSTSSHWATVVGVVGDVRHNGFLDEAPPAMYFPHAQAGLSAYYVPASMNLVIKASANPLALAAPVRAAIHALEPAAPLARVGSMEDIVAASIASRTLATRMLAVFAVVGLLLAGIGIYGVISYGVTQRTFEIGLRVALGAPRAELLRMVVGEGAALAAAGLGIGVVAAVGVARFIESMLVGTSRGDPFTFLAVIGLLAVVALLASWFPARRALAVDPVRALRSE